MTSKWKSCFCKGAQRRAWNWRFSWEVWSKGNVTVWRSTEKKNTLDTTKDVFPFNLYLLSSIRVTMDLLDQEDHRGREWAHSCWSFSALFWLWFLSPENHSLMWFPGRGWRSWTARQWRSKRRQGHPGGWRHQISWARSNFYAVVGRQHYWTWREGTM